MGATLGVTFSGVGDSEGVLLEAVEFGDAVQVEMLWFGFLEVVPYISWLIFMQFYKHLHCCLQIAIFG